MLWALTQAIWAALSAESPSIAGDRIYQQIPAAKVFPYVEFSTSQSIPDDASPGDEGEHSFIDLIIWSRYRGFKEIEEIYWQIRDALHQASLSVSGRASAISHVRSFRTISDPDGITRHGVVTVEISHRS